MMNSLTQEVSEDKSTSFVHSVSNYCLVRLNVEIQLFVEFGRTFVHFLLLSVLSLRPYVSSLWERK